MDVSYWEGSFSGAMLNFRSAKQYNFLFPGAFWGVAFGNSAVAFGNSATSKKLRMDIRSLHALRPCGALKPCNKKHRTHVRDAWSWCFWGDGEGLM